MVEFKVYLRVEDLVLLYTLARQENISVHELILKAIREYVQRRVSVPTPTPRQEEGEKG